MRLYLALALVCGCGRLAFDDARGDGGPAGEGDDAHALCLADDFDHGLAGWQVALGDVSVQPGAGREGAAFGTAPDSGDNYMTHAALRAVDSVRVDVDVRIAADTGDFNIGFGTGTGPISTYSTGYDPTTSENPVDEIARYVDSNPVVLAQGALTVTALAWHHVSLLRRPDGSIRVELDGAFHMESPPDATVQPPFKLVFRLFDEASIDNVSVDCAP